MGKSIRFHKRVQKRHTRKHKTTRKKNKINKNYSRKQRGGNMVGLGIGASMALAFFLVGGLAYKRRRDEAEAIAEGIAIDKRTEELLEKAQRAIEAGLVEKAAAAAQQQQIEQSRRQLVETRRNTDAMTIGNENVSSALEEIMSNDKSRHNASNFETTVEKRARELANEANAAVMKAKEDPKQSQKEVSRLEIRANTSASLAAALEAQAFAQKK